jgi:hypothetical protein
MRVIVKEPWMMPRIAELDDFDDLACFLGQLAYAGESRPEKLVTITFETPIDVIFYQYIDREMAPNFFHAPTEEVICGPALFFREHGGKLANLTDAQIARIVNRFCDMEDQEKRMEEADA